MTLANNTWTWAAWMQFWQVTALIVAVGLLARICCRRRPHLAHLLWLLVILKCLTPPVWSSPTGIFSWIQFTTTSPVNSDLPPVNPDLTKGEFPGAQAHGQIFTYHPAQVAATSVDSSAFASISVALAMASIWLIGALVLAGIILAKWLALRRVLLDAVAPTDPAITVLARDLGRRLGLRCQVRVLVTEGPMGPASLGLMAPTVLLPAAVLRNKKSGELEPILAHELIHIRRGDLFTGIVRRRSGGGAGLSARSLRSLLAGPGGSEASPAAGVCLTRNASRAGNRTKIGNHYETCTF
jgi:bla regulator protein BlaR1